MPLPFDGYKGISFTDFNNKIAVARRLQELRICRDITQEVFAEKYEIPIGTIRRWEQAVGGTVPLAAKYLIRLLELEAVLIKK